MTEMPSCPPQPYSAIIFDCDGTLVDSSELYYRAFNHVVARQCVGMPKAWFIARLGFSHFQILSEFQSEFGILLDPADAAQRFNEAYRDGIGTLREIEVVADVARRHLGRVPIAVASGGTHEIVRATLAATGLLDIFDAIVTVEDVGGRGKPAPDLFNEAARRLGVTPKECTVFEDSDEGIEAARRAGMTFTDVRLVYQSAWRFGIA
jgi:beta-phosphoglucomutase-like phosphatase (HAD superfamily)